VPETWEHEAVARGRPDDFSGESKRHSRTSGHPVRSDDRAEFARQLFASPFVDEVTLDFALELVEQEGLGRDEAPDLLALSFSATDVVGHHYGPYSHESRDALLRLDAGLGRLLEALEARVGRDRLLVALTADHGVLPLPEWLEAQGRDECPVDGGRVGLKRLGLGMLTRLHFGHSPLRWPRAWVLFAGTQIAVNRELAAARGADPRAVAADAEAYLERSRGIAEVWSPEEIRTGARETARLYRNSWDPERSGDLAVQVERGCLISAYDSGTTHGSPYAYDRAVPLVFWGAGVDPGLSPSAARTIDIAPTLAGALGVAAPEGLDGARLF
jgi:predicted AlkP superfamily pyrophosphatase or phosphodiesterase